MKKVLVGGDIGRGLLCSSFLVGLRDEIDVFGLGGVIPWPDGVRVFLSAVERPDWMRRYGRFFERVPVGVEERVIYIGGEERWEERVQYLLSEEFDVRFLEDVQSIADPLFQEESYRCVILRGWMDRAVKEGYRTWLPSSVVAERVVDLVPDAFVCLHSEISEALEEYRIGRMQTEKPGGEGASLVGFPSEVADIWIRALNLKSMFEASGVGVVKTAPGRDVRLTVSERLLRMHRAVVGMYADFEVGVVDFGPLFYEIERLANELGISLLKEIRAKCQYNRLRAYRHGGKVC